jgi:folate-binding protein YgfZ
MSIEQEVMWLEQSVGVRALGDRAVIAVSGGDARDWLQRQITNQLEGAEPGNSVYGFVLTLKGRVLADAWVLVREADVWLDVPKLQVEALLERLDRYIIMEDVDLEHRDDLRIIVAQGPKASEIDGEGWPSDRLGVGGRQWVVAAGDLPAELDRIASQANALGGGQVSEEGWTHAHVIRGRPRFGVDFGEQTYPQGSGLTPIAVSFVKGCYIGQETVVMLQSRGKAPKVLWRWRINGPEPPAPESTIMLGDSKAGEVTSAVRDGARSVALGYLKRGYEQDESASWTIGGRSAEPVGTVEEGPGVGNPQT